MSSAGTWLYSDLNWWLDEANTGEMFAFLSRLHMMQSGNIHYILIVNLATFKNVFFYKQRLFYEDFTNLFVHLLQVNERLREFGLCVIIYLYPSETEKMTWTLSWEHASVTSL